MSSDNISEDASEPVLDETARNVDVVIIGTDLTECILGASLAGKGKKVLHLDANSYYGGSSASLSLKDLKEWAMEKPKRSDDDFVARDDNVINLTNGCQWYMVDRSIEVTDDEDLRKDLERYSSRFTIDLNPRILYCKSKMVDLLLESGCAAYLEFQKLKDTPIIWTEPIDDTGSLRVSDTLTVPVTRQQIFKHKGLSLLEKRQLMRFLTASANLPPTLAFQSAAAVGTDTYNSVEEKQDCKIVDYEASDKLDLSSLPKRLLDGFKYAVCLDLNEDDWQKNKSQELHQRLIQFVESLRVYDSDGCALLIPSYGTGDIVQAFARRCAVESGIHVLRCSPKCVHSTSDGIVEVTTVGGQTITCHRAVISADYLPSRPVNHTITWRAVYCTDKPLLPKSDAQELPYRFGVMSLPTTDAPSIVSVLQTVVTLTNAGKWWVTYFSEEGMNSSLNNITKAADALLTTSDATVLFKLSYRCIGTEEKEDTKELSTGVFKVPHVPDFDILASDGYTEEIVANKLLNSVMGEDDVKLFDKVSE